jgi:hypothetical protein
MESAVSVSIFLTVLYTHALGARRPDSAVGVDSFLWLFQQVMFQASENMKIFLYVLTNFLRPSTSPFLSFSVFPPFLPCYEFRLH